MLTLPPAKSTHQLSTFDRETRAKTVHVRRGERVSLPEIPGPGYVAKLWMTFPGWFWQHWEPGRPVSQTILKTLILRVYVDGSEQPQVAAPAGDFFGCGLAEATSFAASFLGMSSGGFFCGFPMPFRDSLRIEFENLDASVDTEVFLNACYQSVDELDPSTPYFHAQFRTGRNPGPAPLELASVEGPGSYVGCTLACQGEPMNYLSYLEAPEHVYIDDDRTAPRIVGTGMEDYFLGGWYFREGSFVGPDHGVPVKDTLRSSTTMYRIHDLDAIRFERRLRFTFESPWSPDRLRPFAHSSVAFCYLDRPTPAPEIPAREDLLVWYRARDTDHQAIP